ncbi:MAG: hypothetical protein GY950_21165 [bacterium]|nr:hypothetical protein [bacterium]
MIALFEYSDTPFLFRGKDCRYWKKKIFAHKNKGCLEPDRLVSGFDILVLFNPTVFLEIEPEGIDEIFTHLEHVIEKDILYSLEGTPFVAMTRETFETLDKTLQQPDFFTRIKTDPHEPRAEIRTLSLESAYNTLELKKDFRRIERLIVDFQAKTLFNGGVFLEDYNNFYIEGMIPIGEGTRIATGVVIKGACKIGKNVTLYPNAYIENSVIGDNCVVLPGCILGDSSLEKDVRIGPYTHLRNGALVKEGAKMGNFVEMKKSILGKGSKAMHLTYIGDAEVGEKVNIGAGTITCNYDGVNKNKTTIEDGVFIGSGTELVAPVTIKKNSYVAAGSTITEEVPENSLGVARQRQKNLVDWVKRKRDNVRLKKCNS